MDTLELESEKILSERVDDTLFNPIPHQVRFKLNYAVMEERIICEFQQLVELHFKSKRSPEFYSDRLGISLLRLNNLTRFYIACTVYGYLQQRIHAEAIHLLKHSLLSCKEITYELGISDPGYFCRCFKRLTGMSPASFRRASQLQGKAVF